MENLKHISEITHDEAAKEACYKFSAELAIAKGLGMQSKQGFYEAVFSNEALEDLHEVIMLVECLRKLGYGI